MCPEEKPQFQRFQLSCIGRIKEFLSQHYENSLVIKIVRKFGFHSGMRYTNFIERLNKFLMTERHYKMQFCFELFDYNNDGKICEVDLHRSMSHLKINDFFLHEDITFLIRVIKRK